MSCDNKSDACKSKCEFDVDVVADVRPEFRTQLLDRRSAALDFDVKFDVKPKCRVIQRKSRDPCDSACSCSFSLLVDFDCHPQISHTTCARPTAEYRVQVETDTATKCALRKERECEVEEKPRREHKKHQDKRDKRDSYSFGHFSWDSKAW